MRGVEALAPALRSAQPRPRPAFLQALDGWMQEELARSEDAGATRAPLKDVSRPIRVLVAAPCPQAREAIVRVLGQDPGIEVVAEAGDAAAALELARQERPDVALVDCLLCDARAALGRLADELPDVRVLLTAGDPEDWLGGVDADEKLRAAVRAANEGRSLPSPEFDVLYVPPAVPRLTDRERELLQLMANGLPAAEIAEQMSLPPGRLDALVARLSSRLSLPSTSGDGSWGALRRWRTR